MTTIRELLAQNHIDIDQELIEGDVSWTREAIEGPPVGPMRTRVPGPTIDVQIHLSIPAERP